MGRREMCCPQGWMSASAISAPTIQRSPAASVQWEGILMEWLHITYRKTSVLPVRLLISRSQGGNIRLRDWISAIPARMAMTENAPAHNRQASASAWNPSSLPIKGVQPAPQAKCNNPKRSVQANIMLADHLAHPGTFGLLSALMLFVIRFSAYKFGGTPGQALYYLIALFSHISHFKKGHDKTITCHGPGWIRLTDTSGSLKLNTFVSKPCSTA